MLAQRLKGDNGVGTPKILIQHRNDLKYITAVLGNNLNSTDPYEALLGTKIKIKLKIKEDKISLKMSACLVLAAVIIKMKFE